MHLIAHFFARLPAIGQALLMPCLFLALAVSLVACGGRSAAPPSALNIDTSVKTQAARGVSSEYRLGAGDKLGILVFGHKDLSGQFVLDSAGNIAMPLVGQFKAGKLTVTELQVALHKTINENYIVNPRISIEVLNYRPFFILGEVNKPGSYPYVSGIDITQAVALSGGYTRRARTSSVQVTRDTREGRATLSVPPRAAVLPGDTILVGRRLF